MIITLEQALAQFGDDALSPANDYLLASWLSNFEEHHGLVIFVVRDSPSQISSSSTLL